MSINTIGVIFMIMGVVTLAVQYLPGRKLDSEVVPHIERPGDGGPEVIVREVPVREVPVREAPVQETRARTDRDVID